MSLSISNKEAFEPASIKSADLPDQSSLAPVRSPAKQPEEIYNKIIKNAQVKSAKKCPQFPQFSKLPRPLKTPQHSQHFGEIEDFTDTGKIYRITQAEISVIAYSQNSITPYISGARGTDVPLAELQEKIEESWNETKPLTLVAVQNSGKHKTYRLISLDNRRLWCLKNIAQTNPTIEATVRVVFLNTEIDEPEDKLGADYLKSVELDYPKFRDKTSEPTELSSDEARSRTETMWRQVNTKLKQLKVQRDTYGYVLALRLHLFQNRIEKLDKKLDSVFFEGYQETTVRKAST